MIVFNRVQSVVDAVDAFSEMKQPPFRVTIPDHKSHMRHLQLQTADKPVPNSDLNSSSNKVDLHSKQFGKARSSNSLKRKLNDHNHYSIGVKHAKQSTDEVSSTKKSMNNKDDAKNEYLAKVYFAIPRKIVSGMENLRALSLCQDVIYFIFSLFFCLQFEKVA